MERILKIPFKYLDLCLIYWIVTKYGTWSRGMSYEHADWAASIVHHAVIEKICISAGKI